MATRYQQIAKRVLGNAIHVMTAFTVSLALLLYFVPSLRPVAFVMLASGTTIVIAMTALHAAFLVATGWPETDEDAVQRSREASPTFAVESPLQTTRDRAPQSSAETADEIPPLSHRQ